MNTNRPNIYDVAARAGVSHMTVSRVLNGHPNIRESTKERVNSAIDELGYRRSGTARALAMRRAMRLGALVDNPVEYGPNSMLRAVENAAQAAGYSVGSFTTSNDKNKGLDEALKNLLAQDIDGLCVIAPRESSMQLLKQRKLSVPAVFLIPEEVQGATAVSVDQYRGAQLAIEHLIALGHKRIAHLSGPLDWYDARAREQGWRHTMESAGLSPEVMKEGDWTADCGYAWAERLDTSGCTAVFAGNDQMALGVIHGLAVRGVRVPEDVSVVGFDDVPDARHYQPPLTTVRQDFVELGTLAVHLLLESLRGSDRDGLTVVEPTLIERESTAPCQSQ